MPFYKPKNFEIRELVHPSIYDVRGEQSWQLLDARALVSLQTLRGTFGRCTVNDWHWGGDFTLSGLRPFDTEVGAAYSQHKYGRAFDCKFADVTPREVFDYICANPDKFPHITTLEDVRHTPTWLHFDVRAHELGGFLIVSP